MLYVGITHTGVERFKGHRKDKAWWEFVTRIEIERFGTRSDVRIAECNAIADERPAFNVADRGPYAAQAAAANELRRELTERVARLERENDSLRALLRGEGPPDWDLLGVEHGENVVSMFPRHLREPVVA